MTLKERLDAALEKRKSLIASITNAETREALDKIELDIRKCDIEIQGIKESIEEEQRAAQDDDVAKRSAGAGIPQGKLNPLATYGLGRTVTEPNLRATGLETKGIALRKGESLLDRMELTDEQRSLDLGKCIRGMVTGEWKGAEQEQRSLTTTATGLLIPQVLSARVIDMARDLSLFTQCNVPVIPMEEGNLKIARIKNDPTFKFKEELIEAAESNFELESVDLKAKTIYGYAYVSLEAIHSSKNLTQVVYNTFAQAIAQCIDKCIMYGQETSPGRKDDFAPSGILDSVDINVINATENGGYDDFIKGITKIKNANGIPTACGINSQTEELLALLKDTTGQYLTPPTSFSSLTKIVSNQLAYDESAGSDAIILDPNAIIIGMQKNIMVEMFSGSDYCIKNGAIGFRVMAMLDASTVQPKHICRIKGIKSL